MNILGFTITRTKAQSLSAISSVPGSRGWWPIIRELTAGSWQRNEDISVDTVAQNPTLFACISLISGDIPKCEPLLVERDSNGIWAVVEGDSPFWPVLRKPNSYQSRIEFYASWITAKLTAGNTYVFKERDQRGIVRAMHVLDPYRVKVLVSPDGSVFYQLVQDELARIPDSIVVPAREIIHDKCLPTLFHPLIGVAPLYAAGYPAIDGLAVRQMSHKFLSTGSRPPGVLTVPTQITKEQATELQTLWQARTAGDIAVLTGGMSFEATAMTAEQSQLAELLKMTGEDIAAVFHMPRHKVGIGPDPTFNNIEALNQQYYSDCLQVHIEQLELKLDEGLELTAVSGKRLGVMFDLDGLLRMDTAGKADAAAKAVGAGLSYNETRKRFWDVGPVAGGESPLAQQQYYSIAALARRDASDNPFDTPGAQRAGAGDVDVEDETPDPKAMGRMLKQKRVSRMNAA